MSRHPEFPDLYIEAGALLERFNLAGNSVRVYVAAHIRAAMELARDGVPDLFSPGHSRQQLPGAGPWERLTNLANNLHSPPPLAPTLQQAREAARQLAGPEAQIVHAFLSSLEEGQP
jgi:hypothetical protein